MCAPTSSRPSASVHCDRNNRWTIRTDTIVNMAEYSTTGSNVVYDLFAELLEFHLDFLFSPSFWFFWCAVQSPTHTVISWLITVQCIVSKLKSFRRTHCALKNSSVLFHCCIFYLPHGLFACLFCCVHAVVSNDFIEFGLKIDFSSYAKYKLCIGRDFRCFFRWNWNS